MKIKVQTTVQTEHDLPDDINLELWIGLYTLGRYEPQQVTQYVYVCCDDCGFYNPPMASKCIYCGKERRADSNT